jgi:hypothetical protein
MLAGLQRVNGGHIEIGERDVTHVAPNPSSPPAAARREDPSAATQAATTPSPAPQAADSSWWRWLPHRVADEERTVLGHGLTFNDYPGAGLDSQVLPDGGGYPRW